MLQEILALSVVMLISFWVLSRVFLKLFGHAIANFLLQRGRVRYAMWLNGVLRKHGI